MDMRWCKFFDGVGVDIWIVIEFVLDIVVIDYFYDFWFRWDVFVEKFFVYFFLFLKFNGCVLVVVCYDVEEV